MPESCLAYYITDRTAFGEEEPTRRRRLMKKIAEAACAGVDYLQLREKDLPTRELESLAREAMAMLNQLRTENRELRTKLLINSRVDVAMAVGADGIHLRSDDISPQDVKLIWKVCGASAPARVSQVEPLIGVSCHSAEEVKQAEANGATFTVFAPVFEKKYVPAAEPAGLIQLCEACKAKIPVLALGGVTLENAVRCVEAGAAGIAAIRLFQENEVAKLVNTLRRITR